MLRYQLFKTTLGLTSSQLLILKISYEWFQAKESLSFGLGSGSSEWVIKMAKALGHDIANLVVLDETVLMEKQLLSKRQFSDGSSITTTNARLTPLGLRLCENLSKYSDIDYFKNGNIKNGRHKI